MRVTSIVAWAAAIGLVLGLGVGLASQAEAQYPPPDGSVALESTDTTPGLAEEITVSVTVQDQAGVAAAGVACTFAIVQQPGDDVTIAGGPFITDGAGQVSTTLYSGTTDGTIVVEATCGDLIAQVTLIAGEPAVPPASLPDTGVGAEAEGPGWAIWALLSAGVVVGLGGVVLAWRRTRA